MNRRTLFGRLAGMAAVLGCGMAAVLGCGMAATKAEAAEIDSIKAKLNDVLANPDQYPEIMARAREITGKTPWAFSTTVSSGYSTWGAPGFNSAPGLYTRRPQVITPDRDLAQAQVDAYEHGRAVAEGLPIKRGEAVPELSAAYFVPDDGSWSKMSPQIALGTQVAESRRLRVARPLFSTD